MPRIPAPPPLAAALCVAASLVSPALVSPAFAQDGDDAALGGVFPEYVPAALGEYALDDLGEPFAGWIEETSAAIGMVYSPAATVAEQRAALAELRRALAVLDAAGTDPTHAAVRDEIAEIRGALRRRTDLAAVALDALATANPVPPEAATAAANGLLADAVADLRTDLAGVTGGAGWLPFVRADLLDRIAAARGGRLTGPGLRAVSQTLADPDAYEPEQARFLSRPAFRRLRTAVELRLALEPDAGSSVGERPDARAAVRVGLARLATAFEAYEASATDAAARDLTAAAAALARLAPPAGEPVRAFVEGLYDADNARVFIGEAFLRRFIADSRRERGRVADTFRGTRVLGTQRTDVDVDVDVVPEVGAARFDVVLRGVANTRTLGINRRATVTTLGASRFVARKPIRYDGTRFRPGRTTIDVDPSLRTDRIATPFDDLAGGVLRPLIQRIALDEVRRLEPVSRARAERKLAASLRPRLNRQFAEQFDAVNLRVGGVLRRRAAHLGVAPSRERISSTDTHLRVLTTFAEPGELAGAPAPPAPAVLDGVVAQVHQSALNNAADRLGLAGRTVTPAELEQIVTGFFSELFAREIAPPAVTASADPDLAATAAIPPPLLTFADADPIRVKIEAGAVRLTLRVGVGGTPAGTDAEGRETVATEEIPPQIVTVPYAVRLTGDGEIAFERGDLGVTALGAPVNRFRQQAVARVLQVRLAAELPESGSAPATAVLATDARRRVRLRVSSLRLADGWATAVLE